MAIEHAHARALPKPWGVEDLHPWSTARRDGGAIGEIWYERADDSAVNPSLLLKLLFTSQPLSIQVHPDDAFAHSMGLPNGKTEAWYVLSAAPDAKVALGLNRRLTPQQLRAGHRRWLDLRSRRVAIGVGKRRRFSCPPATIHAIGAGLVIAELQQRSDTTFRLFDHGRNVNFTSKTPSWWRTPDRLIFRCDRTSLPPSGGFSFPTRTSYSNGSIWRQIPLGVWKRNERLGFSFSAAARVAGSFDVATGDALFAQSDHVDIHPGATGMVALVAYTGGGPIPHLLQRLTQPGSIDVERPKEMRVPTSLTQENAAPNNGRLETIK